MMMMTIVVVGRNEELQLTVVAGVDVDSRMRSDYGGGGVGGCDGDGGEDGGCGVDCSCGQMMMREQVEDMRCDHVVDSCDWCYGGDKVRRRLGDGDHCYGDDGDGDMGRWEILSLGKIVAVVVAVYLVGSDHCVHGNVVVGCHGGENGGNSGGVGGWSDIVVLWWCRRESWDHCCWCCCCSDGCSGWRTGAG